MSLQRRIVVLVLAVLVASYAAVAVGTYVGLHQYLLGRLDQQLSAAGNRYVLQLEHGDRDGDEGSGSLGTVAGQAVGTLGARVLDGSVTAFGLVGQDLTASALSTQAQAQLATVSVGRTMSIDLDGLGVYRLQGVSGRDGDVLVTGLPEHELNETIAKLLALEAVILGVALLGAAAVALPAVRLALRPLTRVTDLADVVSTMPLHSGSVALPAPLGGADQTTEVGRLSTAFDRMLRHIETSLHARQRSEVQLREFLADASHELRTPLTIIRGYSELALRPGHTDPDAMRGALQRIEAEAGRMGVLVEDLLLLARLDALADTVRAPVDLSVITIDVVAAAGATAPDHRWVLKVPEQPVTIEGDERQLRQLLTNLVVNARVHTPAGTTVTIELGGSPAGAPDAHAHWLVTDDGPGIPIEAQDRIFERFARAPETGTGHLRGSGLGLAIVAAVVAAHHGQITFSSGPAGTAIGAILPIRADDDA